MESDLVDILIATYNSNEKYLREQIDSILNQTYKNIKIYISDDASPKKDILTVLEEYQRKDNRVIVFKQKENLGFNKNFEFLLNQSTAEYIMFCDHDDIWYDDKVEKSLLKLKEKKVSMVYANSRQIDEFGATLHNDYFKFKNVPLVKGKNKLAISRCVGLGCSQIITKDVKNKMIPFKESTIAHDWLAAFIANENNGIDYIYEPLFDYRLHSNNVFGGRNLNQNLNRWKKENGKTYASFKKYRQEVIDRGYLSGAKMCYDYSEKEKDKEFTTKLIEYLENIKKSNIINIHIITYFKLLGGKNLLKKIIKEIAIFHFPLISFLIYKIV